MTDALTKEKIIDAMRSSIEGFAFLVVDSLEFELKRQLTDAEQQEVSTVVEQLVLTFPEPCPRCGATSTRPNGEHYCHVNSVEAEYMTSKQLTRERLEKIKSWRETYGAGSNVMLPAEEAEALARMALAAMESEPVAWINGCNKSSPAALRYLAENPRPIGGESSFNSAHLYQLAREIELMSEAPLYRHAQPAPDLTKKIEQPRKKVDRCDVCTEGARGGCGTCAFNYNL